MRQWMWVCWALALVGCSPALNWRNARHDGVPLQALMPCKPERAERAVPLLGPDQPTVPMWMMSCEADGTTFAVAAVRLPPGASADRVVHQWRQAGWISLGHPPAADGQPPPGWAHAQPPGASASAVQVWRGPGRNHLGQAVPVAWQWLVRGEWVVQGAMYGPQTETDARATFFDALRWDGA